MEAAKNVVLEPLASALAVAAFLHNVIMAAQHHNATLCKEAWEKKLPAQVTECTCYCINNCDGNFFRSVGKEWQKLQFYSFLLFLSESLYNPHQATGANRITLAMPGKYEYGPGLKNGKKK